MSRRVSIFGASFASGPVWQAETTAYMTAIAVPADGTLYYPSTIYERTGLQLWQYVDAFVIELKDVGISKFKAVWPRIGGTANRHKWNMINPLDTDAAHRNQFFGGITHSATGAKPNGTNGFFNLHIRPTQWTYNNVTIGFYLRQQQSGAANIAGLFTGVLAQLIYWYPNLSGANDCYVRYAAGEMVMTVSGHLGMNSFAQNATTQQLYVKTTSFPSQPKTPDVSMQSANIDLFYAARNDSGTAVLFGNREEAGGYVADYLTPAEVMSVHAAFQTLNTSLGRQV